MNRPAGQIHQLEGYISGETEKAILVEVCKLDGMEVVPEEKKKEWFPLSQVTSITRQPKGSQELESLVVSNWILRAKGLA